MSYAVKLEKILSAKNFKISKNCLLNSVRIPSGYILRIDSKLRTEYPLLDNFILSCYKTDNDFSNAYGFNLDVAAKFPIPLKNKFILDSFYNDGYIPREFNSWATGHYLLVTKAGIPFGIFGIADKAGFPQTYQTLDYPESYCFELPNNALLFSIAICKNYQRKGLSIEVTEHFLKVFNNYPIYETISVANLANQNAVIKMNFTKIGKLISKDPLKASVLLYTFINQ